MIIYDSQTGDDGFSLMKLPDKVVFFYGWRMVIIPTFWTLVNFCIMRRSITVVSAWNDIEVCLTMFVCCQWCALNVILYMMMNRTGLQNVLCVMCFTEKIAWEIISIICWLFAIREESIRRVAVRFLNIVLNVTLLSSNVNGLIIVGIAMIVLEFVIIVRDLSKRLICVVWNQLILYHHRRCVKESSFLILKHIVTDLICVVCKLCMNKAFDSRGDCVEIFSADHCMDQFCEYVWIVHNGTDFDALVLDQNFDCSKCDYEMGNVTVLDSLFFNSSLNKLPKVLDWNLVVKKVFIHIIFVMWNCWQKVFWSFEYECWWKNWIWQVIWFL